MEIPAPTDGNNDIAELNGFQSPDNVLKELADTQIMIDVMATKLFAIRKLGLNEFTMKEIRILEGKLIKHFSQQLDVKKQVRSPDSHHLNHYPSLTKLLSVAGVGPTMTEGLQSQEQSVENLMKFSDVQLQSIVSEVSGSFEDTRKLKAVLEILRKLQSDCSNDICDLYWDSWSKNEDGEKNHDFNENLSNHNRLSSKNGASTLGRIASQRGLESSVSPPANSVAKMLSRADHPIIERSSVMDRHRKLSHHLPPTNSSYLTPPYLNQRLRKNSFESEPDLTASRSPGAISLPPHTSVVTSSTSTTYSGSQTPPMTPGTPHKTTTPLTHSNSMRYSSLSTKGLSRVRGSSTSQGGASLGRPNKSNSNALMPAFNNLKPSKSSEWHIGHRINNLQSDNISSSNQSLVSISTLPTGPSKLFSSKPGKKKKRPHDLILDDDVPNFIAMSLPSRRSSTTVSPEILSNMSPLSPRTPMTPTTPSNSEMWSKDREVSSQVGSPHTPKTPKPSLKPFSQFRAFLTRIGRKQKLKRNRSSEQMLDGQFVPRSPSSSPPRRRSDTLPSSGMPPVVGSRDVSDTNSSFIRETRKISTVSACYPMTTTETISNTTPRPVSLIEVDRTMFHEPTTDRPYTVIRKASANGVDSENDSTMSEGQDPLTKDLFRRGSMMQSEEWDIPYSELEFSEKIGRGRVGSVYRGNWHGDVAIRVIDINHNDEEKLRAFKQEIMIYKKTRHENLELFMGSCMDPPRLAIVTGFCRGNSLYNYIRESKTQFININQAKIIAQHIVQGMGYLHSKGIIHKDLKSKNIFVDGKKFVITDFGLVGLHAVSCDNTGTALGGLMIPDGWLCYLAPEVLRALRFPLSDSDDVISTLPYTMKSDVFAFGTVWYELLSRTWPFHGYCAESIIWQAGNGKKQNLSQLQGGRDVKDIIMRAWAFSPDRRPDFSDNGIMGMLKNMQTQIHRSLSSHPRRTGASRGTSHERLFDGPLTRGKSETDINALTTSTNSLPRPTHRVHQLLKMSHSISYSLRDSIRYKC